MFISQSGNSAAGDVIAGDQINHITQNQITPTAISKLYEKLRRGEADNAAGQISDQLRHFCRALTDGDLRGLEAKLIAADRADLVRPASHMKELAAKLVMKWQTSGVAQDILTLVLSKIYTDFIQEVSPAIQAGHSRNQVDSLINEKVISPANAMLGENDLMLSTQDLLGLIFFLGGNCHIRWDKC